MKKAIYGLIGFIMVVTLFLAPAPRSASAIVQVIEDVVVDETWILPQAPGMSFGQVSVSEAAQSAPSWLQLFYNGIIISQPTKICHTFRRGQFSWVPKIMQLKEGKWIALSTTKERLYGEEGSLYACAQPAEAGTYALFAYYNGPVEGRVMTGPQLFTVGSWEILGGVEPRPWEFGDISAYDVNWNGYPTAARLGWGIQMCWPGSGCHDNDKGYVAISPTGYPQNYDVAIREGTNWGFDGSGTGCRFAPYVELQDTGGNTIIRIYYESEYAGNCVS